MRQYKLRWETDITDAEFDELKSLEAAAMRLQRALFDARRAYYNRLEEIALPSATEKLLSIGVTQTPRQFKVSWVNGGSAYPQHRIDIEVANPSDEDFKNMPVMD